MARNLRRDTTRSYRTIQSKFLSLFTLDTKHKGNSVLYSFLSLFIGSFLVYAFYYYVYILPKLHLSY